MLFRGGRPGLASSGGEVVATLRLPSAQAEGDCGRQFPSEKDKQGVTPGLMAVLCFGESGFLPRVIPGVTPNSHNLLQLKDYRIIKVLMSTHGPEQPGGDKGDGGSKMLSDRTTVHWNCVFILGRPISQLTCVNISVFTHAVEDFYNSK